MDDPRTRTESGNRRGRRRRSEAPHLFLALQCASPLESGARFCLGKAEQVTIGRGALSARTEGASLRIEVPDPRVSSQHVRLSRVLGEWVAEDLGSRNGTVVNGAPLGRVTLGDGARIEAGQTFFIFRDALPEAPDILGPGHLDSALPGLITLIPALASEFERLPVAAKSKLPILLQGETGTGKEMVARALHEMSGRGGPFVAVNCGALPAMLVESELFGYRKGAFTGAVEERAGLIRSADGGTLLLDEIGDLPLPAQAALLRVLQEEEVMPIGGTRAVKVGLRVVAATHRDLQALVEEDKFRRDLFARLKGFTLTLPPLRERREDLGVLVASLLRRIAPGRALQLTAEAGRIMLGHGWPENVRELAHCLERAAVFAEDDVIDADEVRPVPREAQAKPAESAPPDMSGEDRARCELIISLLREKEGNVTSVARAMGKARTQVQRWLRRYGIDPLKYRP